LPLVHVEYNENPSGKRARNPDARDVTNCSQCGL
jgi:hypothetical protein